MRERERGGKEEFLNIHRAVLVARTNPFFPPQSVKFPGEKKRKKRERRKIRSLFYIYIYVYIRVTLYTFKWRKVSPPALVTMVCIYIIYTIQF